MSPSIVSFCILFTPTHFEIFYINKRKNSREMASIKKPVHANLQRLSDVKGLQQSQRTGLLQRNKSEAIKSKMQNTRTWVEAEGGKESGKQNSQQGEEIQWLPSLFSEDFLSKTMGRLKPTSVPNFQWMLSHIAGGGTNWYNISGKWLSSRTLKMLKKINFKKGFDRHWMNS